MSADNDSQMLSSPDGSDVEARQQPSANASSILTPPDSQHHRDTRNMPLPSTSGSNIANSNGKRPIQTISNGHDDMEELAAMANGKARQDLQVQTHPSGYQWTRVEDEPGHQWLNKKATDEFGRAWDALQHRDLMVKNRYGDPFEVATREQAGIASIQRQ